MDSAAVRSLRLSSERVHPYSEGDFRHPFVAHEVYAIKMAGVFMISTSTVALYTGFAPRWIAVLGYVLALALLFGSYYIGWSIVVLPAWVFLVSIHILIDNFRKDSSP